MTTTRIVLCVAIVGAIVVAVFPPYRDEHGYSRGHSLFGSPPPPPKWMTAPMPPITMPDGTVFNRPASPPPLPARIDWALLIRSEIVIALVAWGVIAVSRKQIDQRLKRMAITCLVALVLPIPFWIPPLGMMPTEFLTDSNHGIPAVVFLGILYVGYVFFLYVFVEVGRLIFRPRAAVPR